MVATVTVFAYASVHPRHFVCTVQRGQRPPQFLIEQHPGAKVIADHSGYRCVIEPLLIVSRGSDAVSAAYDTS